MKGPLATQSLRGMANHGPMHWRGDRTGGYYEPSAQPDSGSFDEEEAFRQFNPAFVGLVGRDSELSSSEMQAFTDFILQVTYPPNPIRALDNSLTPEQQAGKDWFFSDTISDVIAPCHGCHTTDANANPGTDAPGFFGTNSSYVFDFQFQLFKVAHLRNQYQKIGMFGLLDLPIVLNSGNNDHQGDQVRGFGYLHDGTIDTVFRFVSFTSFDSFALGPGSNEGFPPFNTPEGQAIRRGVESFLFAFDSNMAPIVGQQITLTDTNSAVAGPRIDLLIARANAGECDLVAKSEIAHEELGFLYIVGGDFITNRQGLPAVPDALLRQLATAGGHEVTYTCTPPGSGERIGIDRDGDGFLDGDEEDAGTDPADPTSPP
jgi:hypothetical protein